MDVEVPLRSIGRRIREIRDWRGMTLDVVAGLAGISEGYLSRLERGERPVNRRLLGRTPSGSRAPEVRSRRARHRCRPRKRADQCR
ncbi:MAG: helix-turn-helix domain-containing protein [Pseudonocardiaceae bacterium]